VIAATEKLDWLAFELQLPALVFREDRFGTRAEGTVIQKSDCRIKQKFGAQVNRHR
jgi:hypothetical protein